MQVGVVKYNKKFMDYKNANRSLPYIYYQCNNRLFIFFT